MPHHRRLAALLGGVDEVPPAGLHGALHLTHPVGGQVVAGGALVGAGGAVGVRPLTQALTVHLGRRSTADFLCDTQITRLPSAGDTFYTSLANKVA